MAIALCERGKSVSHDEIFASIAPALEDAFKRAHRYLDDFAARPEKRVLLVGFIARIHEIKSAFILLGSELGQTLAERVETLAAAIHDTEQLADVEHLKPLADASAELGAWLARAQVDSLSESAATGGRSATATVRAARKAALSEVLTEFARIGNTLNAHWREAPDSHTFVRLAGMADRLAGVLEVLTLAEPARLMRRIACYFERMAPAFEGPARAGSEQIADAVVGIECWLNALRHGREPRALLLENTDHILTGLGIGVEDRVQVAPSRLAEFPDTSVAPPVPELPPARIEGAEPATAEVFIEEAEQILATLGTAYAHWRGNPLADREALATLRCAFLTLAGSAGVAGAERLGAFARAIEDLLNCVSKQGLTPGPKILELVGVAISRLPSLLEQFKTGTEPHFEITGVMARAWELAHGEDRLSAEEGVESEGVGDTGVEFATLVEPQVVMPRLEPELYTVYRAETLGHLATLTAWCEAQERGEENVVGAKLLRAVHTLAGSSKMAGVAEVGAIMTPLEQALERVEAAGTDPRVLAAPVAAAAAVTVELLAAYGDTRLPLPRWTEIRDRVCALRDVLPETARVKQETGSSSVSAKALATDASAGLETSPAGEEEPAGPALESSDPELIQLFAGEAAELLEGADTSLRAWRADHALAEPLSDLLRRLHTLKGGARMASIAPFADLVHDLESFFTRIAEGRIAVSAERLELGEHALDELHHMLEHLSGDGSVPDAETLRERLREETASGEEKVDTKGFVATSPIAERTYADASESIETEETAEPEHPRAREQRLGLARVRTDLLEASINSAAEVGIYRGRIAQQLNAMNLHLAELERTVERVRNQMRELEMETEAQIISSREQRRAANLAEFDPLEFDRYTHIHELSRSLAEAVSDLTSLRSLFATGLRLAGTALDRQGRVNAELQDTLLRTRMMPFALSEGRLRRVVRQVAEETGKRVEFRFTDMGGEMDRLVLEHILPALEHLLRNAVVHGIESAEERRRLGKPEAGNIELIQRREGAETVVEVTDDGRGLDFDAIRARAQQEGLIADDAEVSERELVDLVFRLGFTTAGALSQAAGRGVGMNVVAAETRYVGGNVEITAGPEGGTRAALRFPATLAIGHTLLIRVGARRYLVPLAGIGSITRVPRTLLDARLKAETPGYEQGGETYELVSLARALGEPPAAVEDEAPRVPLLLVSSAGRRVAFVADDMEGSREVVIKPVGPQVAHIPGVSGASLFDDGTIGLLLDLAGLVRAMPRFETGAVAAAIAEPIPAAGGETLIMVADDSITVRRVTERVLARHGVRVLSAKDGVEALELLADHTPELLLLDIEMPRMNGYELAEHMRNDERLRSIPIIIITSRVGEKHRARAAELGIERYLGKPYQESELLAAIRSVMGGLDAPLVAGGQASTHDG